MVRLIEPSGEGCRLLVRLTPKSSRDGLDGIDTLADGRLFLKARVRAVPEKGKAKRSTGQYPVEVSRCPDLGDTHRSGRDNRG